MENYKLRIKLLSDASIGRGDGVAGLVDREVEHDPYGFPYLRGRTLKGLLSEECDNLIAVLSHHQEEWKRVAARLFGNPGSTHHTMGIVRVGDACLPEDLRQAVAWQIEDETLTKTEILDSLTTIRRQTAIDAQKGVAEDKSLRSHRVILRELCFQADLMFERVPDAKTLSLLAVGALALRRLGSGRNRGLGHVFCTLCDTEGNDVTRRYAEDFGAKIEEEAA